jgi:hypothetical protein
VNSKRQKEKQKNKNKNKNKKRTAQKRYSKYFHINIMELAGVNHG